MKIRPSKNLIFFFLVTGTIFKKKSSELDDESFIELLFVDCILLGFLLVPSVGRSNNNLRYFIIKFDV